MFVHNSLTGNPSIVAFILLGERVLLTASFRQVAVGVQFLDAGVAGIGLPCTFWMKMYL